MPMAIKSRSRCFSFNLIKSKSDKNVVQQLYIPVLMLSDTCRIIVKNSFYPVKLFSWGFVSLHKPDKSRIYANSKLVSKFKELNFQSIYVKIYSVEFSLFCSAFLANLYWISIINIKKIIFYLATGLILCYKMC